MSNREYAAAVLEDGPASKEQRMDAIVKILSERVNEAAQNIIREGWTPAAEHHESFGNVVQSWFKEINPELAEDYSVVVGTIKDPVSMSWRIVVAHRPKIKIKGDSWFPPYGAVHAYDLTAGHRHVPNMYGSTIDATHITAGSITSDFITADSITADSITAGHIRPVRVVERFGMGVINTGGTAIARHLVDNITDNTWVWNGGNDGLREQLPPADLTINGTTYHGVTVTGVVGNV